MEASPDAERIEVEVTAKEKMSVACAAFVRCSPAPGKDLAYRHQWCVEPDIVWTANGQTMRLPLTIGARLYHIGSSFNDESPLQVPLTGNSMRQKT